MDDEHAPGFSRLVFDRALSDTGRFFGYRLRDAILFSVTLILGGLLAWKFVGAVDTANEISLIALFTVAPTGVVAFFVFVWHLWLAPAAVTYEAANATMAARTNASSATRDLAPVNWKIWQQMSKYTIYEFAAILAQVDPVSGNMPNSVAAYVRAMIADANDKILPYIVEYGDSYVGKYVKKIDEYTSVERDAALKWANGKGFPYEHVA